jgi:hypothetical protein
MEIKVLAIKAMEIKVLAIKAMEIKVVNPKDVIQGNRKKDRVSLTFIKKIILFNFVPLNNQILE